MLPLFASNVNEVELQAILRSAIEVYPVGIVVVDALGNIVLANSEMERIFGYTADEIIGRPVDMLVHQTCNPNMLCTVFLSVLCRGAHGQEP